jgi:hypothetical protein
VPERSTKEESLSKGRCIEKYVSREDTGGSGRKFIENEARSPWLMRDGVESEEYEAHSSCNSGSNILMKVHSKKVNRSWLLEGWSCDSR